MGLVFTRLFQDCYPEIWSQILVVNAPTVFQRAFDMFKPVLRSHALERIHVVSRNLTKETLLKYIDEDVLPVFLGGTKVDSHGDPQCKEFLSFGGDVPETMYRHNRAPLLNIEDPGVKFYNIGPRSWINICIVLREGRWVKIEARTENGSVDFQLLYRKFEEVEDPDDPILPSETEYIDEYGEKAKFRAVSVPLTLPTHCCPLDNYTFLPFPGVYVSRISNQGSWFTSRKLFFRATILPADFKM